MLSGKPVFDDIRQHETVFNKKMAGENPTIPVIKFKKSSDSNKLKVFYQSYQRIEMTL